MGTRYIPLSEVAPGLPLSPKKKPVPQDEDALVRQHRGVTFDDEPATAAPAAAQPSEGVTFAEPTQQQQPAAAPQQSYPEIIGHFGSDVLQGLGAGVLSTIFHGGDLLRRATGQPRIIDTPDVRSAITPPESLAGKLGYGGEKMAEFFIPAGAVGRAGQAVEAATAGMRGAGALNLAARAALEGRTWRTADLCFAQVRGSALDLRAHSVLRAALPVLRVQRCNQEGSFRRGRVYQ